MSFLPDPKELKFGVGGLRQQYDKMKKVGRCPYDSFEEYMRDFFSGASTRRNEKN